MLCTSRDRSPLIHLKETSCSNWSIVMILSNFNAMAMEPVGHMAGLGAAITGSVSTFVALPLGWAIGAWFDGTLVPIVGGFALFGFLSVFVMWWTERGRPS